MGDFESLHGGSSPSERDAEELMVKQVLVVKKMKVRTGKIGSQCAHGATKVFFDRGYFVKTEDQAAPYELRIPCTQAMKDWVDGIFTKICVYVETDEELEVLRKKANELGIVNALIEDNGLTEFHGVKTKTVLAVGPDTAERVDLVTGGLPLL